MKQLFQWGVAVLAAFSVVPASAACFSVYDAAHTLVYRDITSPVDLQEALRDTVPGRFGKGATMIIAANGEELCSAVGLPPGVQSERLAAFETHEQPEDFPPGSWASTGGSAGPGRNWGSGYGSHRHGVGPSHIGPRGGVFHYSGGGRKVYEPRSGGGRRR